MQLVEGWSDFIFVDVLAVGTAYRAPTRKLVDLDQFDAAIFGAAFFSCVVGDGCSLAEAFGGEAAGGDAVAAEPSYDGLSALFGQDLIGGGTALIVGVGFNVQF